MNVIRGLLLDNLGVKLVALLLAVVVYLHVYTERPADMIVSFPLEFEDLPDSLSPREVQILALVAEGLSNREIGGRLSISEHTAANHIRSILRKTESANRTEAASYAHLHGLASR